MVNFIEYIKKLFKTGIFESNTEKSKLDDKDGNCKMCGHPFEPHLIIAWDTTDFRKGGIMKCPVENCPCHRTIDFNLKTE